MNKVRLDKVRFLVVSFVRLSLFVFLLAESSCVLPSSGSGYLILSRNALVFRLFSQRLFRDPCHNHYGCASPGYLSHCGGKGKTFFYRFLIFFVIFFS